MRRIRNRSCMNASDTSASDIVEGRRGHEVQEEGSESIIVSGICANTSGRVTKTSVAPQSPLTGSRSPNDFTA